MSSKIEERILSMRFNNDNFLKNVADTNKSLESLKKGLNLSGAAKGLGDLANAGKNFSLGQIANGVDAIAGKFTALSVIGITALANIASRAVDTGLQLANSLTLQPIKAGFDEYELKMGSIQTILSNTARYGTSLEQVTGALDNLNTYADKTIYNFGDMTKNIGLFTNAGLRVEEATSMIKGFSNEAAASGTNAQGAASAAYQLSQALSAGTIRLMDWRSLQNVGMGNKNMQNGLIEIANAMGTLEANSISAEEVQKDFNGSLEKGWLSADVMSKYLGIMAGDMDAAAMSALGLNDEQIAMFQTQQKNAEDAATKVRTWTQLVGTLQESVGSGWAQTFDMLIGDFNEATDFFTKVNDTLGGMIGAQSDARNNLIKAFVDQGGRNLIIESLSNAFTALMNIIKPIQEAFQEIFPPVTAEHLIVITTAVRDFTASLIPSELTMLRLKNVFKGVFAALDIGRMVLVEAVKMIGRLFTGSQEGANGLLNFASRAGDFVVKLRDAIKNGEGLSKFFEGLGKVIQAPLKLIGQLVGAVGNWIAVEDWAAAWQRVQDAIGKVGEALRPVMKWLGEAFQNVKQAIGDFMKDMDPSVLVGLLNAGLLGGVFVLIKKFVDSIPGLFGGLGGGIFDTIKGAFGQLTDTMKSMQDKLKADALIRIAIAVGILTAAVIALSFVDTGKLFISLGAIATMFTILAGTMALVDKIVASKGFLKMPALAAAMILMATAMVIFAAAVTIMAGLEWDELARGLTGLAGGLTIMVGALVAVDKFVGPAARVGGAMILLATSLVIMAGALKILSTLSWDDILRSMVVLSSAMAVLVTASLLAQRAVAGAPSMILMSISLGIMAGSLKAFATMNWDEILRSMTVMAGSLLILTGAVAILSSLKSAPVGVAMMLAMATAMTILMGPLKAFGEMSWEEIGKAMVVLAGSLAILAGAMALMGIPIVLLGSVGILAASVALMTLAPALKILGSMSWDDIGRGLTVLAGALGILAVGGVLLIPAIPTFIALGTAALLIGTGAFLAGIGLVSMAAGITALAAAAAVGSEAIKMVLNTIIGMMPQMATAFAQGLVQFAVVISESGTQITAAMTTLMMSVLDSINQTAPALINTVTNIVSMLLTALTTLVPQFVALGVTIVMSFVNAIVALVPFLVDAGLRLVTGILNGIANNIGSIVDAGTNIVVNFLDGIGRNIPRLVQSGIDLVVNFVNGVANGIRNNTAAMESAGRNLASAIIDGMVGGIGRGIGSVISAARNMAQSALNAAKSLLGINSPSKEFDDVGWWSGKGQANGMLRSVGTIESAGKKMGEAALYSTQKSISKIASAVATNMELSPVITPVIDLSNVRKGASLANGLLQTPKLSVDNNYAVASSLSSAYRENEEAREEEVTVTGQGVQNITLNQYNSSPKALSNAEIYRRTKNGVSTLKGKLDAANRPSN